MSFSCRRSSSGTIVSPLDSKMVICPAVFFPLVVFQQLWWSKVIEKKKLPGAYSTRVVFLLLMVDWKFLNAKREQRVHPWMWTACQGSKTKENDCRLYPYPFRKKKKSLQPPRPGSKDAFTSHLPTELGFIIWLAGELTLLCSSCKGAT